MNGLAFWRIHGRGPTLRERLAACTSLAELEAWRLAREDVARILGDPVWPGGEGPDYARRKAELGKAEAGKR